MKEWERREAELLARENAWYNNLSPFMKVIDNHLWFCLIYVFLFPVSFGIGLLIGLILWK